MSEQSKWQRRKRKGLYFFAWEAPAKKLAQKDPGSGVREAEMEVDWGKKNVRSARFWKLKSTGTPELSWMRRMSMRYIIDFT